MVESRTSAANENSQPPSVNSGKERKATKRDYIVSVVFLVFVLWYLGLLDTLLPLFNGLFSTPESLTIPQHFNVLVPIGTITVDRLSGQATAIFTNSGTDEAEITDVNLVNMDGYRECSANVELPVKLDQEEKINLIASDCAISTVKVGSMLRLGVIIKGKTTLRSRLLTDTLAWGPMPVDSLTPEQREIMRQQMQDQIDNMPDANQIVDFSSSGILLGY